MYKRHQNKIQNGNQLKLLMKKNFVEETKGHLEDIPMKRKEMEKELTARFSAVVRPNVRPSNVPDYLTDTQAARFLVLTAKSTTRTQDEELELAILNSLNPEHGDPLKEQRKMIDILKLQHLWLYQQKVVSIGSSLQRKLVIILVALALLSRPCLHLFPILMLELHCVKLLESKELSWGTLTKKAVLGRPISMVGTLTKS